jgi:hypothetical protein
MNRLLEIADAEHITIEYRKLSHGLNGFYISEENYPPFIAFSYSLRSNYRLHSSVLAEELGHHFTSVGERFAKRHHSTQDRLTIDKVEYKALRWAANHLVPEDDLLDVIKEGLYEIVRCKKRITTIKDNC